MKLSVFETVNPWKKLPVVIEAIQFTENNLNEVLKFCPDSSWYTDSKELVIKTLEDGKEGQAKHVADIGDFIIKGVRGKFYPCKPNIFEETYELVD